MTLPAEILSTYESISGLTGNMLAAARASDWDKLVELEKHCAGLIDKLRAAGSPVQGDSAFQQRKAQILHKVLADDAAIRSLTQPWLAQLQNMLENASCNTKLSRAYGGTGTLG